MPLWTIVLLATLLFFSLAWIACEVGSRLVARRRQDDRIGEG